MEECVAYAESLRNENGENEGEGLLAPEAVDLFRAGVEGRRSGKSKQCELRRQRLFDDETS